MKSKEIFIAAGQRIEYQYLLAFSIVLGCVLRFYQIGGQSLWLDEAFSHWFSSRTIVELWTIVPKFETNPPLYYTILKIWKSLFGSSEACLRSLSALMSIGCIPLVFTIGRLMGKSIGGNWLGAIAALLFSIFPIHIEYAQEARPYAMLAFATTLTLCAVLWMMRHPAEACKPIFRKSSDLERSSENGMGWPSFLPWIIITVAIAFTLWLHNTSALYIFTLALIILAWFILELRSNRTFFGNLMTVAVLAFLLWAPWLISLIHQTMSASLPIPEPTALSTMKTVVWLLLGTSVSGEASVNNILKIIVFVFLFVLAAMGLLNIRRHSGKYAALLILGAVLGPILMELLLSITFRPIFLARTLIYVSIPFSIAIAAGIMMLRDPRKRALVIIMISLMFLKWTYTYYTNYEKERKEPWDKIAQTVARQAGEDVVLLLPNNIELPFSYYARRIIDNNLHIVPLPFPVSDFLHPSLNPERLGSDSLKAIQIRPSDISAINSVITRKSPVWLITRREDLFDKDRIVYNILVRDRNLISSQQFGEISVLKFN